MHLFDIYKNLWTLAQNAGAFVHYYTWVSLDPPKTEHDEMGATGWFDANHDVDEGQPIIRIYRLECDDDSCTPSPTRGPSGAHLPPPDLHEELITLAHEYGHLCSFLGATARPDWDRQHQATEHRTAIMRRICDASRGLRGAEIGKRFRAALTEERPDDERDRLVREETTAWDEGLAVLQRLGLIDFKRYNERREQGLHAHRYRLGLHDAWPSDLEDALSLE
jgi:hypothetical protein